MTQRIHQELVEAVSRLSPAVKIHRIEADSVRPLIGGEVRAHQVAVETLRPYRPEQPQKLHRLVVDALMPIPYTVSVSDGETPIMTLHTDGFWRPLQLVASTLS